MRSPFSRYTRSLRNFTGREKRNSAQDVFDSGTPSVPPQAWLVVEAEPPEEKVRNKHVGNSTH